MDIGVYLPPVIMSSPVAVREIVPRAEELGYHSLWLTEHIVIHVEPVTEYPYTPDHKRRFTHEMPWGNAMVT